jgi:hypothetical protein
MGRLILPSAVGVEWWHWVVEELRVFRDPSWIDLPCPIGRSIRTNPAIATSITLKNFWWGFYLGRCAVVLDAARERKSTPLPVMLPIGSFRQHVQARLRQPHRPGRRQDCDAAAACGLRARSTTCIRTRACGCGHPESSGNINSAPPRPGARQPTHRPCPVMQGCCRRPNFDHRLQRAGIFGHLKLAPTRYPSGQVILNPEAGAARIVSI